MVKRSTMLLVAIATVVGLALGGFLFQTGAFEVPQCYSYEFTDKYNATFTVSLHDPACVEKFGVGPYTYRWNFDHFDFPPSDPNSVQTMSPEVDHRFPAVGMNLNVGFSVFDSTMNLDTNLPCGDNCPYSEVRRIVLPGEPGVVIGNAPDVSTSYVITASFVYTTSGYTVSVDGGASGGAPPYTFEWEWDDGTNTTDTDGSESHAYAIDGTYTITMVVTDSNEVSSEPASKTLTFQDGECTANCGEGTVGLDVIQIAQIALVVVGLVIAGIGLFRRKLLLIIVGLAIIGFGVVLTYLVV